MTYGKWLKSQWYARQRTVKENVFVTFQVWERLMCFLKTNWLSRFDRFWHILTRYLCFVVHYSKISEFTGRTILFRNSYRLGDMAHVHPMFPQILCWREYSLTKFQTGFLRIHVGIPTERVHQSIFLDWKNSNVLSHVPMLKWSCLVNRLLKS